jgi:hypothetical protein
MKRFLISADSAAIVIALWTLGACGTSDNAATRPMSVNFQVNAVDSALIAVHASADATFSDVNTLNASTATDPGTGCTFNPADGRFDCPPTVNANGVTVARSLAFFDTAGTLMNHFDSTTASMNVQATLSGVVITAAGADTVNGTRNLTAAGLFGHNTTRTWNGSGSGTHGAFWADSAASRTADVSYSSIFTNVVVALPRSANPYPVSGTISRAVTGTGVVTKGDSTRTISISRSVVITFNGTEFVPMTVGDENYTLDLATGKAVKS